MNKSLYRHIGILVAYYILFQSFSNLAVSRTLWPYLNGADFVKELVLNFIAISIIYVTNYIIVFLIWKHVGIKKKLFLDLLTSIMLMFMAKFLLVFFLPGMQALHSHVTWADAIFDNFFILAGLEIAYFVRDRIWKMQEINKSKQKMMQYQNDILRSQVNPHFLFNTLNVLYSLVDKDAGKSKLFILSLSHFYRYMLEHQKCEKVLLCDEVQFVKEYVRILSYRYSNRFDVDMGELPVQQKYVIPFTLQLLVENVVKHNKISTANPVTVKVMFGEDSLTVSNFINRKEHLQTSHIGMEYIRELYKVYGKQVEVVDNNITYTVKIPYIS